MIPNLQLLKHSFSLLCLLSLLVGLLPGSVMADEPPQQSAVFYGEVTINGGYAPVGTSVKAFIDGTEVASVQTFADSDKTVYSLKVSDGTSGATVNFQIAGTDAPQTGTWESGGSTALNLNITAESSPPPASAVAVSIPTDIFGNVGSTVQAPIVVDDTTDKGIISFQGMIKYDASVLQPVRLDLAGSLTASGWNVQWNTSTPGEIQIAAYSAQSLEGSGTLLSFVFNVLESEGLTSPLSFHSFSFNEGTPTAEIANGNITKKLRVQGKITYGTGSKAVSGVDLSVTGPSSSGAIVNAEGVYALYIGANGDYVVTPQKSNDLQNAISSADALYVARQVIGLYNLHPLQLVAGDVNTSGEVTAYDAALILRYLAEIEDAEVLVGDWIFQPESRTYSQLSANKTDQDYVAILIGDVTFDWSPAQSRIRAASTPNLSLNAVEAQPGTLTAVPISLSGSSGYTLEAVQLEVLFDPAVLTFHGIEQSKTLSEDWVLVHNVPEAGRLILVGYGLNAIEADGTLVNLNFEAVGEDGDRSSLIFNYIRLNEDAPHANPRGSGPGEVIINGQWQMFLPSVGK